MDKIEREKLKKKIALHEKLGAEKMQKVVFKVEEIKYKIIKKFFPNYIERYNRMCNKEKNKELKKATTQKEREKINKKYNYAKMAMQKEFYLEKNRNYHMDLEKPTEIIAGLKWNKSIHIENLKGNLVTISVLVGLGILGYSWTIPFIIIEVLDAAVNFECINLQDYNLCRFKIMEEQLQKREQRNFEKHVEEFGDVDEIIETAMKTTDVSNFEETANKIIKGATLTKLYKMKKLLLKQSQKYEKKEGINNVNRSI